jgi:hypothetical protein
LVEQRRLIGKLLRHIFYSGLGGGSRLLSLGKRVADHRFLLPLTIQLPPQLIGRCFGSLGFGAQAACNPEARKQAAEKKSGCKTRCERDDITHKLTVPFSYSWAVSLSAKR